MATTALGDFLKTMMISEYIMEGKMDLVTRDFLQFVPYMHRFLAPYRTFHYNMRSFHVCCFGSFPIFETERDDLAGLTEATKNAEI